MDDLDRKILSLLAKNARMPVKEIAEQVALTSPAVSSRIHKRHHQRLHRGAEPPGRPCLCGRAHQPVRHTQPPGRAGGADAEQQGGAAVLPCHRCLHLPHQGQLRQHAPAGAPDPAVPEAGHHQHPDHPFHAGEPRRAGCPYAVTLFIK